MFRQLLLFGTLVAVVSCDNGTTASQVAAAIRVEQDSITMPQKGTRQITPTVLDKNGAVISGARVTFLSNNPAIVTVSPIGEVTSVGPAGSATITVKAAQVSKDVSVVVNAVAARVSVSPDPAVVPQKSTLQLTANLLDLFGDAVPGATFTYASSDPTIATVSAAGLVTAVGPAGALTIAVRSGNFVINVGVTVTQVPTTLLVTPKPATVPVGRSRQLTVRVRDAVGADIPAFPVEYESSQPAIVTVSSSGVMTSVGGAGSATIIARAGPVADTVPVAVKFVTHPAGVVAGIVSGSTPGFWRVAVSNTGLAFAASISAPLQRFDRGALTFLGSVQGSSAALDVAFNSTGTLAFAPLFGHDSLLVIDALAATVIDEVPLGSSGYSVVVSRDDRTAYVGTNANAIVEVDIASRRAVATTPVGLFPTHLTLHPFLARLFASGSGAPIEFDPATRTVLRRFTLSGMSTQGVAVNSGATELYVAQESVARIDVWDLISGQRVASVAPECAPFGLAVTPDDEQLYVMCDIGLRIIDLFARTLIKKLPDVGRLRRASTNLDGSEVLLANEAGQIIVIR